MSDSSGFRKSLDAFLMPSELPCAAVLAPETIKRIFRKHDGLFGRRGVYSTVLTLWAFLGHVLRDGRLASCQQAVNDVIAYQTLTGGRVLTDTRATSAKPRASLSVKALEELAGEVATQTENEASADWFWKGPSAKLVDGTTVTIPDTPENQKACPHVYNPPRRLGFPIARLAVLTSLACGAAMELGMCRYAGKEQSEQGMLRRIWDRFRAGDVLLTDRLLCSCVEIATLKARGVDSVTRLNANRTVDFRRGRRLGKGDHIVQWPKPVRRGSWDRTMYDALPASLSIREPPCVFRTARIPQPIRHRGHHSPRQ
jgi:hypothetical protein